MNDAATIFADAHADLMSALGTGEAADASVVTVKRGTDAAVPVRLINHNGVQQVGEFGRVLAGKTVVDFLRSEWLPMRGDVVTINGVDRPVESIAADDGYVVQAVLHG